MTLKREPIRVDIPHEEGHWMELRLLPWKKLRDARKIVEREQRASLKEFGAELVKVLMEGGNEAEQRAKRLIADQEYASSNFDTELLLRSGIASWSYDLPVCEDNIGELDERTAKWAVDEIIRITRPPSDDERKNSTPDSITHSMEIETTTPPSSG